jgi:hypothetical protein
MEPMMILRALAAVLTVLAAANVRDRSMVCGFSIFILASIAWIADGWLEDKASLVIQNAILLLINMLGVWRWLPKAENEPAIAGSSAISSSSIARNEEGYAARAGKR